MDIFIRADASVLIGTGHVMRCLTLAERLREAGAKVSFICRELDGNLEPVIMKKGFETYLLPGNIPLGGDIYQSLRLCWQSDAELTKNILKANRVKPAWLIVDHYALDEKWQLIVKPYVNKIMVIDDLADRRHSSDVLLDQNYTKDMLKRYNTLVPPNCKCLIGPRYFLLRPEFVLERKFLRERNNREINNILIFFGGGDPTGETLKAIEALATLKNSGISVNVVVGAANPWRRQVEEACLKMPQTKFYCQTNNMAKLMAEADLAIGAAGVTTWERCYLGLPAIVTIIADNQAGAGYLEEYGALITLGRCENVTSQMIKEAVGKLIKNPTLLKQMSRRCFDLMEGHSDGWIIEFLMEDVIWPKN